MTDKVAGPDGSALSEGLGSVGPKQDRATSEPDGCQCEHCGCIFIGGPENSICGDCFRAYKEAMRQEEQRAQWHAEMRRDAFGA